jgi:hypothetical protein
MNFLVLVLMLMLMLMLMLTPRTPVKPQPLFRRVYVAVMSLLHQLLAKTSCLPR